MMMTRFRQSMRDDFPRGWWRSAAWWRAGVSLREPVSILLPVLTLRRVREIVRLRDNPVGLASREDIEAYGIGLGANVALMLLTTRIAMAGGPLWVVALLAAIALVNGTVCAAVVATVARSRLTERFTWAELDYVDRHAPVGDRPPDTVEEHEAVRLRNSLRA